MRIALARHDELMRVCCSRCGGYVFKTVGDAFCVAFGTAADAVKASLEAQLELSNEPWPQAAHIKVRMALHTGAAEIRDDDYFGQPLNRVARLLSAAHGGQVLLSLATQELARDALPPGTSLRDMGERRLKDLNRPERVFQLIAAGLPVDFPPLKTLDARSHNLPVQTSRFVGREAEMQAIKALLRSSRLVTLLGSGGCGKTRLSMQVAADLIDNYADGVWLIEFAPLSEASLVPQTLAVGLGIQEEAGIPIFDSVIRELKEKEMLIVMDNCEHLIEACASVCQKLVSSCSQVDILTSSREALRVPGEATFRVPSLSTPDPLHQYTVERLTAYETVQLFIDRAMLHNRAFTVTNENAPALASVCYRLDGIPLAIELAAARIRNLSLEEVNQRLDHRFRLLTGGSRTALPRQQTLRSLIDWSYDLLNEAEQNLLQRLSTFSGGWTLEAAEHICHSSGIEDWEVFDLLTSLSDKSLVTAEFQDEVTRYRLLETVREYAEEHLIETGQSQEWRDRHVQYFLELADGSNHQEAPKRVAWLDRLEVEEGNIRAALEWCAKELNESHECPAALQPTVSLLVESMSLRRGNNELPSGTILR
jgi:predicted ATPase